MLQAIARSLPIPLLGVWLATLPGEAIAQPVFTDVTASAGINYVQHSVPTLPFVETAWMSGGAAAGDYNGDGWIDLFVTRLDDTDILYRNEGDGSFEDVSVASGLTQNVESNGAAWADIDNDGDLDLFVTSDRELRNYLFINDGQGLFSEAAVARGVANDDGVLHLGQSAAFADYDGDGWLDLHVSEWANHGTHTRLFRNLGAAGAGFFEDRTVAAGLDTNQIPALPDGVFAFTSRFADFDDDGWPDLAIAGDFSTSRLFWNNGDGTFSDGTAAAGVGSDENGMGSAIGDIDGDGRLDWFITSIYDPAAICAVEGCNWGTSGNRLFRNVGNRQFIDVTDTRGVRDGGWGWGAAFLDYDNDGDLDLSMANGQVFGALGGILSTFNSNPNRLWRNDGPGSMTEIGASAGVASQAPGKGLLVFDYDRDGDLDFFVSVNGDAPLLLRNDGGNANGWLRVRVRHTAWQRDAIGARVEVQRAPGEAPMMREIFSGSHFLSQSETVAHFGIASHAGPIHRVRVYAPGEALPSVVLRDVDAGQTLTVTLPPTYVPALPPAALLALVTGLWATAVRRLARRSPTSPNAAWTRSRR